MVHFLATIYIVALRVSMVLGWRLGVYQPIPLHPDVDAQVAWSRDEGDNTGPFTLQAIEDGRLTSEVHLDGTIPDGISTLPIGHPLKLYFQIVDQHANTTDPTKISGLWDFWEYYYYTSSRPLDPTSTATSSTSNTATSSNASAASAASETSGAGARVSTLVSLPIILGSSCLVLLQIL